MIDNVIVTCIVMAVIGLAVERSILNPLTIFSALWAALVYFQRLGLYELYETDVRIYAIILTGVVAFVGGYLFDRYVLQLMRGRSNARVGYCDLKWGLYLWGSVICILFFVIDLYVIFPYYVSGGMAQVRAMCQDADSIIYTRRSGVENAFRTLFVLPFSFAVLPATAVALNDTKNPRRASMAVICCLLISVRVLSDGGRSVIAYFVFHVVLAFYFHGGRVYINDLMGYARDKQYFLKAFLKRRRRMYVLLALLVAVGVYLLYVTTIQRSGDDAAIHAYFYVAMQGQMFQVWSEIVDQSGLVGYGLGSLNGFLYPFIYAYKNLMGYTVFPGYWGEIVGMIGATDSEWQWMSGYGRANAYVSLFWFFYLDGRWLGVAIGMFIYGAVSARLYRNAIRAPNDRNVAFAILLFQGLLFSMVRLQFANVYYAWSFVYIIFMYRYRQTNERIRCEGGL